MSEIRNTNTNTNSNSNPNSNRFIPLKQIGPDSEDLKIDDFTRGLSQTIQDNPQIKSFLPHPVDANTKLKSGKEAFAIFKAVEIKSDLKDDNKINNSSYKSSNKDNKEPVESNLDIFRDIEKKQKLLDKYDPEHNFHKKITELSTIELSQRIISDTSEETKQKAGFNFGNYYNADRSIQQLLDSQYRRIE